jgi:hypothetical protein
VRGKERETQANLDGIELKSTFTKTRGRRAPVRFRRGDGLPGLGSGQLVSPDCGEVVGSFGDEPFVREKKEPTGGRVRRLKMARRDGAASRDRGG